MSSFILFIFSAFFFVLVSRVSSGFSAKNVEIPFCSVLVISPDFQRLIKLLYVVERLSFKFLEIVLAG